MRISDWSSDVCSSDFGRCGPRRATELRDLGALREGRVQVDVVVDEIDGTGIEQRETEFPDIAADDAALGGLDMAAIFLTAHAAAQPEIADRNLDLRLGRIAEIGRAHV